jgi:hypothetical protein
MKHRDHVPLQEHDYIFYTLGAITHNALHDLASLV